MREAQKTPNETIRSLWQDVKALKDGMRLRSPAQVFYVLYQGAAQLQRGNPSNRPLKVARMQLELEGMLLMGHFPRSGRLNSMTHEAEHLNDYLKHFLHARYHGENGPDWGPAETRALKEVMMYATEYLGKYKELNGHLPLLGPYSKEQDPHPWDASPWQENPFDNRYSRG